MRRSECTGGWRFCFFFFGSKDSAGAPSCALPGQPSLDGTVGSPTVALAGGGSAVRVASRRLRTRDVLGAGVRGRAWGIGGGRGPSPKGRAVGGEGGTQGFEAWPQALGIRLYFGCTYPRPDARPHHTAPLAHGKGKGGTFSPGRPAYARPLSP